MNSASNSLTCDLALDTVVTTPNQLSLLRLIVKQRFSDNLALVARKP